MNTELQKIVDDSNIATERASSLIEAFGAPFNEAGEILSSYREIVVTDESQVDVMKQARDNRLILKKVRTTVENKRKELKEDSLRTGKAIDAVAKYIKDTIQPAEAYLEEQEKFAEIKEANRIMELKNHRIEALKPYSENPYTFEYLGEMTDEEFSKLLQEEKASYELKKAQQEAYEREQKRIQEEREAEEARIREENEILRKQAEAREAEIEREREAQELAHQAEVEATKKQTAQTVENSINALERFTVEGVNGGRPMIDYDSVINLLSK